MTNERLEIIRVSAGIKSHVKLSCNRWKKAKEFRFCPGLDIAYFFYNNSILATTFIMSLQSLPPELLLQVFEALALSRVFKRVLRLRLVSRKNSHKNRPEYWQLS
jgi:hypothetical protein